MNKDKKPSKCSTCESFLFLLYFFYFFFFLSISGFVRQTLQLLHSERVQNFKIIINGQRIKDCLIPCTHRIYIYVYKYIYKCIWLCIRSELQMERQTWHIFPFWLQRVGMEKFYHKNMTIPFVFFSLFFFIFFIFKFIFGSFVCAFYLTMWATFGLWQQQTTHRPTSLRI